MKNICILALLLAGLRLTAQEKKLDSIFSAPADFSGVLLVAEKGNAVFQQARGYREFAGKIPMEPTDIFELASLTKQFTAMIIMMLKEKNRLQYDDLLEKYIEVPYKGITLRHLLTHTSGLPDYQAIMDKYWDKSKIAGNEDAIAYLNKYAPPKRFEPGEKYEYSNTGYLLLASVAEKASGRDYIRLCRRWIFRPLKMKTADIRTLKEKAATSHFAIGHIYVKERDQYVRADSFRSSDYTIWLGNRKGPGRISAAANDLLKWDQALYTSKLIKPSTLQEAFTPMTLNNGAISNYGFGWGISSDSLLGKVVTHTGDNPGYKTQIVRYIDKNKTIILLNNNAHPGFATIIREITAWFKTRL